MKRSAFLLLLLFVATWFPSCKPGPKPLEKLFQLPPFTLTERSGQPFDSASMRGKIWVANFFFATCQGICPALNQQMALTRDATVDHTATVHFLSISTDEADTPERLRAYAENYRAGDRWFFLTGKKDPVFDLSIRGFKLALVEPENVIAEEKFIHSSKLVLIDRDGWIRGYYEAAGNTADAERQRLLRDIQRLIDR